MYFVLLSASCHFLLRIDFPFRVLLLRLFLLLPLPSVLPLLLLSYLLLQTPSFIRCAKLGFGNSASALNMLAACS